MPKFDIVDTQTWKDSPRDLSIVIRAVEFTFLIPVPARKLV